MNKTNNTRQATWVALGSLFSFGFGIVSSMILSRYFDKGDYGTYKQVLYVYNTLLVVFTLGLPRAYSYFLPRVADEEAKSVIQKINTLFFVLGGVFSFLLFIGAPYIADFMNNKDLESAIKIFSPVPLLMLPTMGLEAILATYKKTQFLAYYNIVTRLATLLCVCVPIIFWNGGLSEALIGFLVASIFSFVVAMFLKYLPVKDFKKKVTSTTYKDIFDFSLPLLYASLWGMIIKSADQFFISRYYGNETFAEYSNGATELPFIGMIIGACSTVLSPIFSRLQHQHADVQKDIYPIWINVFKKSAMLIYPILLLSIFYSDILMIVLYGEKYATSYVYFCIISIANFFSLIAIAPLLIGIGKVRYYANVHMISAILLVVLEFIVVSLDLQPCFIAVVSTLCHIARIFAMLYIIAKFFNLAIKQLFPISTLIKIVCPSVLILITLRLLVTELAISNVSHLIIVSCAYLLIFMLVSKWLKLDYISILKPLQKNV